MIKNYILISILAFLFIVTFQKKVQAQFNSFEITRCETPEEVIELVKTVFLDGVEPFQYQNIEFHGNPRSVGYFEKGGFLSFNKAEGIVMSSGFSETLDNGNNCNTTDADSNTGGGTDADLAQAAGFGINDACVIEFDFMPAGDSVKFNYAFGSEEYPEFVNQFNDAFGFFLSGPGIAGPYSNNAINIAQIPGTNDPVTINNVNCGQHGQSCNPNLVGGSNCELYINNLNTLNRGYHQTHPANGAGGADRRIPGPRLSTGR